jgi:3-hydroxy acid dehydrogenase / malonic semialdehyde reductase
MPVMKTVLITGASSGFGKATAQLLAKYEYKLILIARRKDILQNLQKELETKTYIAAVDVSDRKQVENFFAKLPSGFQDIDVLINCAGLALGVNTVQESSIEDWERMIDTNIKGTLYFTKFVLEGMIKRNSGLIVTLGSVAATTPYKGGNVYGGTKAFIKQFARDLRTDLFGTNIKVTNIDPGAAETEFSIVRFGNKKEADDYYEGMRPLVAQDVARTIAWVIEQPEHVDVDNIEIMSVDQTYAGFVFNKKHK